MKNRQKIVIAFIAFFILIIVYVKVRDTYRENALKESSLTSATIEYMGNKSRGPAKVNFNFVNSKGFTVNTSYYGNVNQCIENLKKGDTILIKYSIEDNEIAQIVHCYWNDDLRKLVEEQKLN